MPWRAKGRIDRGLAPLGWTPWRAKGRIYRGSVPLGGLSWQVQVGTPWHLGVRKVEFSEALCLVQVGGSK